MLQLESKIMIYILKVLIAWALTMLGIMFYCLYFEENELNIYKIAFLFLGLFLVGIPSVNYWIEIFNKFYKKE